MMTGDVNWGYIAGRGGFRLTMVVTKLRLAQLAVADCPLLPGRWPGLFLLHWVADGRGGSPRKALPRLLGPNLLTSNGLKVGMNGWM